MSLKRKNFIGILVSSKNGIEFWTEVSQSSTKKIEKFVKRSILPYLSENGSNRESVVTLLNNQLLGSASVGSI